MSFSIRNFPENFTVLPLREIIKTYRLGRIFPFKTAIQETLYRCKIGLYYVLKGRSISDCLYPSLRSILRICRDLLALISFFFTWTENLLSHWKVTAKTAIFIVSLSWQQQQQQQKTMGKVDFLVVKSECSPKFGHTFPFVKQHRLQWSHSFDQLSNCHFVFVVLF